MGQSMELSGVETRVCEKDFPGILGRRVMLIDGLNVSLDAIN
jgi:hypothetical protein